MTKQERRRRRCIAGIVLRFEVTAGTKQARRTVTNALARLGQELMRQTPSSLTGRDLVALDVQASCALVGEEITPADEDVL